MSKLLIPAKPKYFSKIFNPFVTRKKKCLESVETYRGTWLGYKETEYNFGLLISILVPQIQGGLKRVPSSRVQYSVLVRSEGGGAGQSGGQVRGGPGQVGGGRT